MSEILKDRGIVLKKKNYRETSKLITLFSESHGKINLIAKGVRTPKSKLSAVLEPLNLIEFVYYKKTTRDLQYLSSAEFLNDFTHIKNDLRKIQVAFAHLEITNLFVREDEKNPELFLLLEESLIYLNSTTNNPKIALIFYLVNLLNISGYPVLGKDCSLCQKNELSNATEVFFSNSFGFICIDCSIKVHNSRKIGANQKDFLISLKKRGLHGLENYLIDDVLLNETISNLKSFISHHIGEFQNFKSLSFN